MSKNLSKILAPLILVGIFAISFLIYQRINEAALSKIDPLKFCNETTDCSPKSDGCSCNPINRKYVKRSGVLCANVCTGTLACVKHQCVLLQSSR